MATTALPASAPSNEQHPNQAHLLPPPPGHLQQRHWTNQIAPPQSFQAPECIDAEEKKDRESAELKHRLQVEATLGQAEEQAAQILEESRALTEPLEGEANALEQRYRRLLAKLEQQSETFMRPRVHGSARTSTNTSAECPARTALAAKGANESTTTQMTGQGTSSGQSSWRRAGYGHNHDVAGSEPRASPRSSVAQLEAHATAHGHSSHSVVQRPEVNRRVKQLLLDCGLDRFLPAFEKLGVQAVRDFQLVLLAELSAMGMKTLHRKRFQVALTASKAPRFDFDKLDTTSMLAFLDGIGLAYFYEQIASIGADTVADLISLVESDMQAVNAELHEIGMLEVEKRKLVRALQHTKRKGRKTAFAV